MTLPVPGRRAGATVPGGESAPWLITLADLVLVLLCMFTVLATRSEGRGGRGANGAPEQAAVGSAQDPTALTPARAPQPAVDAPAPEQSHDTLRAPEVATSHEPMATTGLLDAASADMERDLREILLPAGGQVEIERAAGELTVRLRDSISFLSGSAELLPSVLPFLDGIAELLIAHPRVCIETSGHTDDLPITTSIYPSNWELSTARAAAVARYLLGRAGLDPARIRVAGYAEHRPIDPGHTPEGRARNRRVEIRFQALVPRAS